MPRHVVINGRERHLSGWRPDKPDHRDIGFRGHALKATPAGMRYPIAQRSDLRGVMPAIEDQGALGSCVFFSWTAAVSHLHLKRGRPERFSKLFGYYVARVLMDGRPPEEDSGLEIRDGAKAVAKYGLCLEGTWPYDISRYAEAPPRRAYVEAMEYQAIRYYRLADIDWIRACLTMGYPVVFGFAVPERFGTETGHTAELPFPAPDERFDGGHAVCAVGHDDERMIGQHKGALLCRNSWGQLWGDDGHFWMPYEFFRKFLALDAWTVHEVEDGRSGHIW